METTRRTIETERITVRVPCYLADALRELAAAEGVSVSECAARMLDAGVPA